MLYTDIRHGIWHKLYTDRSFRKVFYPQHIARILSYLVNKTACFKDTQIVLLKLSQT